jgi:hypothetical protein
MKSSLFLGLGLVAETLAVAGKSYTTWDCCKPACAWRSNLNGVK